MTVKTLVNKIGRWEVERADRKVAQRMPATKSPCKAVQQYTRPKQDCSLLSKLSLELRLSVFDVLIQDLCPIIHIDDVSKANQPTLCQHCWHRPEYFARGVQCKIEERDQTIAQTARTRMHDLFNLMRTCSQLHEEVSDLMYTSFDFHFIHLTSATRFFSTVSPQHLDLVRALALDSSIIGTQSESGQFEFRRGLGSRRTQVTAYRKHYVQEQEWLGFCQTLSTLPHLRLLNICIDDTLARLPEATLLHPLHTITRPDKFVVHLQWQAGEAVPSEDTPLHSRPFELRRYGQPQPHIQYNDGGYRRVGHSPFPPWMQCCCLAIACPFFACGFLIRVCKIPYKHAVYLGLL